jgi:hypothetical protein
MHWTSNRRSAISRTLIVVALTMVIAACGSAASAPVSGPAGAPPADAGKPVSGGTDGDVGSSNPEAPGAEPGSGGQDNALTVLSGPLIVRTGSLTLEVADLDAALVRARAAIAGLGGYVSGSQRTNGGGEAVAAITYRIPATRWDDALDALAALSTKVVAEDTKAVEVTAQVVDLDARIANLRSTEQALQGIMAKATRISDVLEVQNQLTSVQGQIEQLTAQRNHLADQAAFATLSVAWSVPLVAVAEATEGFDLGAELDRATAQLLQLGQGLLVVGVWLVVVVVPIVGGIALAIGLAMLMARRLGLVRRPTA